MKRYEWIVGRLCLVLLLLALVLVGNPVARAQEGGDGAYLITNVVATSNAPTEDEAGPENTVNGSGLNANGEHSTRASDMWLCLLQDEAMYIQFEFDAVYELHEMHVWNYNVMFEALLGFGVKDVTIEYSENGTDWTVLGDVELAQGSAQPDYVANTIVSFGGVSAKYVKLTIRSGWGMLGQAGLSEVRFFSGAGGGEGEGEAPPSYALLLDDFESYTVHNVIFDSWYDGWVNNTGSTVGYLVEPFVERDIVHSGLQSMPLFYNNMRSPFYSEAIYELESELQDWSGSGADALTLYFHGGTGRADQVATDRLYVVVEDDRGGSTVVRHPDSEALLSESWQEWTIGFEELGGVDLSCVERLTVGVGDRTRPQAGGNSIVYIDDVGLSSGGGAPSTGDLHPITYVVATSNAISEEETGPENTVNGSGLNNNCEHSTVSTDMWLGQPDGEPVYIQFAFGNVYKLEEMWVWNYNSVFESILGFGVKDVSIEYSTSGTHWMVLGNARFAQASGSPDYVANTIVPLGGIRAKYVRLNIQSGWGVLGQYGLSEVKFFTGQPSTAPSYALLLDDFEGYTAHNRIYDVWFDGWMNGTNSTVGYFTEPFAERWIVHSGLQAMPLFYDNIVPPFYAETYRELEPELQNWSTTGADALTLCFHGSMDLDHNITTDRLYIKVEDNQGRSSTVYHPDAEALLAGSWQEWTIGLDEFAGVNLSRVARLMLGIGNRDNPQPGGTSVVYFDDIGLSAGAGR